MTNGRSVILFVPEKNASYLRNCRFMKMNPALEFEQSEENCLSLIIKEETPEVLQSIIQSKGQMMMSLRESKHMTFNV